MKRREKFRSHEIKTKSGKRTFISLLGPEYPYLKRNKLLGAYVPNRVHHFFSVIAIVERKSLSELLKSLVMEFIDKYDEKELLDQLCHEALDAWNETLEDNEGYLRWNPNKMKARWNNYKKELEKTYLSTLPEYYRKQIIKYIEEAKF